MVETRKKNMEQAENDKQIAILSLQMSVITPDVNRLNSLKRNRVTRWIKNCLLPLGYSAQL